MGKWISRTLLWIVIICGVILIASHIDLYSQGQVDGTTLMSVAIFGLVLIIAGIFGLYGSYLNQKKQDTDGDGIPGDGLPATKEQRALIEKRFREIGQYIDKPSRHLTQGQAREILRDLEKKK